MCGRFYIDDELSDEMEQAIKEAYQQALRQKEISVGEVLPTQRSFVIVSNTRKIDTDCISWGYEYSKSKRPIINARRETLLQKPMFCDDFIERRCLVPARGFYEWNDEKKKYYFQEQEKHIIYMAGIYTKDTKNRKFTIITTSSNESVSSYHDRMPILVEDNEMIDWLNDFDKARKILYRTPKKLIAKEEVKQEEYEQIHIFNTFNL